MVYDNEPFESDPDELAERLTASAKPSGPSLKARAIDFLSRREHSRVELQRKLRRHSDEASEIEALLDELEHEKWLSDDRFAQSLINRRAHKLGTLRIVQELRQNGVEAEKITELAESLRHSEYDRAYEVWDRKFGKAPLDQKSTPASFVF
ncbi:recombination regulator RecX [Paenalcaligenes niemegkensis]|uniref:recombination regulator RecX n=1 Tax=Paenalcaligenes niemegkensis TaxID=2895469 RepID=UPI001EE7CC25|nr:recombination regulator RecX [Paenalcaligenes niemegkensis]MCQ9616181.1 recombination regulator RecX [Paenalcaligenes niemegkensis]